MVRSTVLSLSLLLCTTAAVAATQAPQTPVATNGVKPVKEKLICEQQEQVGSRLGGHRVCKTAAQWADERQQARMAIDRSQTQRACSNGSAGC